MTCGMVFLHVVLSSKPADPEPRKIGRASTATMLKIGGSCSCSQAPAGTPGMGTYNAASHSEQRMSGLSARSSSVRFGEISPVLVSEGIDPVSLHCSISYGADIDLQQTDAP